MRDVYKRQEYGRILADKAYVDSVLKSGAERAARLANRTAVSYTHLELLIFRQANALRVLHGQ